ncbi:MAG: immunoglobulin domain-containing protein [Verrucomicrobia bacterium]|nr:immunoglobulin domain-containing protein [Verrucomicrobiota bacterium]
MDPNLAHPYPRITPFTNAFGDINRGPEPSPDVAELPLVEWDEALARATANQGNPYEDYGHFRLRAAVWQSPYFVSSGTGAHQMTAAERTAAAALYSPTQNWGDGALIKYQLMAPPAEAPIPPGGWPLVVLNPGSGALGRQSIPTNTVLGELTWASPYFRQHYPAYVLVFHPQQRTVRYPDKDTIEILPALHAGLEVIDHVVANHPINVNRLYTLGFSMGGATVWQQMLVRPNFFAAAVPAAGRALIAGATAEINAVKNTPIWMFMGNQDPWAGSSKYIRTYQDLVAAGAPHVRFWEVQDMGHVEQPMMLFHVPEWLWQQSLDNPIPPPDPLAAPQITQQPQSQTATPGQTVTFSAGVSGNPIPALQWFKAGEPIAEATSSSLVLVNVQVQDAGQYYLVASNSEGYATSNTVTLNISTATAVWEKFEDFEGLTIGTIHGQKWLGIQ